MVGVVYIHNKWEEWFIGRIQSENPKAMNDDANEINVGAMKSDVRDNSLLSLLTPITIPITPRNT